MLAPLHLCGERLLLDPAGVLAWPARRTLIAADLHLEKGSHFARRGRFVPPYDTRETLSRLASALRRHGPERLILLGDTFHDPAGARRLCAEDRALLARLLAGRETVWIAGNHDPAPPDLPGEARAELADGPLRFRHQARPGPAAGEVSGHFHPRAALLTRAGGISRPCFLTDGRRLVLPAFGAYTGGLDASDPALATLFPLGARAFLLGAERLHAAPVGRGLCRAAGGGSRIGVPKNNHRVRRLDREAPP